LVAAHEFLREGGTAADALHLLRCGVDEEQAKARAFF
jgi:hypothetical protein